MQCMYRRLPKCKIYSILIPHYSNSKLHLDNNVLECIIIRMNIKQIYLFLFITRNNLEYLSKLPIL